MTPGEPKTAHVMMRCNADIKLRGRILGENTLCALVRFYHSQQNGRLLNAASRAAGAHPQRLA